MKRIGTYFFRQGLTAFLFAVFSVTIVVLLTQTFRLLTFVIDNSGTMAVFFQLMGLMIPTFLPLVVPLALGIAVTFVYHKMAVDSEIVVLRSAGISPLSLAAPALVLSAMVAVFCYVITMYVAPAANRELVKVQYRARDNFSAFLLRPGTFNDVSPGMTFYVRARGGEGGMKDILIHDTRNRRKPVTIMAARGLFSMEDDKPQVTIFDGKRQEIDRETGRLSQINFDRYVLDLEILKKDINDRLSAPREQTMAELLNPPADSAKRRSSLEQINAELHQRLATPLLAISYAFIGIAAVLAGEFNRRGMLKRMLAAAVAIIAVQAATLWLGNLMGKDSSFIPAMYLAVLLPVPVCFALLAAPDWAAKFAEVKQSQEAAHD